MYWYFKYCIIYFNWLEKVVKLQYNIAMALSDISTNDWWTAVLLHDKSSFERLQMLFETKKHDHENSILEIQRIYMGLKNKFKDFRLQLEEEEPIILSIIPKASGLYIFLIGKTKSRYTTEDYQLFRYFDLWLCLKSFIFVTLNKPLLKEHKAIGDYVKNGFGFLLKHGGFLDGTIYDIFLFLRDIQAIYKATDGLGYEQWITIPLDGRIFDEVRRASERLPILCSSSQQLGIVERQLYKKMISYVIKSYEFVKEIRQEYAMSFTRQIAILFAYLNTALLGIDTLKVINVIKESPLATTMQIGYWLFRARHPGQTTNLFSDIEVHPIITSADFLWGESRLPSCFNLPWHWPSVQKLYELLISNHYISKDTDARNFCYALTGCKPASTWVIKKVNWVHKEKQSLALFIGELRKRDQRHLKWTNLPNVFLYNGQDVQAVFTRMDVQCKQASDNGKFADLLETITKAELYHPAIKEMLNGKGEA